MNREYTIQELHKIYTETLTLVTNRPDAVCTPFKGRGRSIFQRKLANIKSYAAGMRAGNPTEQKLLDEMLGRKLETENSKYEFFQLPQGVG